MSFYSLKFIVFFVALLGILLMIRNNKAKQVVLLIASYIFYAMSDIKFVLLLLGVSTLMWFLAKKIEKEKELHKKRLFLIIAVLINCLVLGFFKYFNFFAESFYSLLGLSYSTLEIVLPLGISFYIFQSISYVADVYMQKISARRFEEVLLYIGFFPQIVSGPIVKARDFMPQLEQKIKLDFDRISWGGQKFLQGLFKKIVIADRLSICVDAVYSAPIAYSGLSLLFAVLSYSLQIYYDFSGYSDMAIGIAHMLGFDLGNNFNLPYLAKNPSDFWRRWHISLSTWFRDYVYIPLGGSKKGRCSTYLNLFITMLLSGLWHGASWSFVIWGGIHALLSVVHKVYIDFRKKVTDKEPIGIAKGISVFVTFILVTVLWIPFRVGDLNTTFLILKRILCWSEGIDYVYVFTCIFSIMLVLVEVISLKKNQGNDIWKPLDLNKFSAKIIVICYILIIVVFAYFGNGAFIYAQF